MSKRLAEIKMKAIKRNPEKQKIDMNERDEKEIPQADTLTRNEKIRKEMNKKNVFMGFHNSGAGTSDQTKMNRAFDIITMLCWVNFNREISSWVDMSCRLLYIDNQCGDCSVLEQNLKNEVLKDKLSNRAFSYSDYVTKSSMVQLGSQGLLGVCPHHQKEYNSQSKGTIYLAVASGQQIEWYTEVPIAIPDIQELTMTNYKIQGDNIVILLPGDGLNHKTCAKIFNDIVRKTKRMNYMYATLKITIPEVIITYVEKMALVVRHYDVPDDETAEIDQYDMIHTSACEVEDTPAVQVTKPKLNNTAVLEEIKLDIDECEQIDLPAESDSDDDVFLKNEDNVDGIVKDMVAKLERAKVPESEDSDSDDEEERRLPSETFLPGIVVRKNDKMIQQLTLLFEFSGSQGVQFIRANLDAGWKHWFKENGPLVQGKVCSMGYSFDGAETIQNDTIVNMCDRYLTTISEVCKAIVLSLGHMVDTLPFDITVFMNETEDRVFLKRVNN